MSLVVGLVGFCQGASAQVELTRLGVISSYKDFGLSLGIQGGTRNIRNTFEIKADMEGMFSDKEESVPGIKLTYLHQNALARREVGEEKIPLALYAGGGLSTGYVRDRGIEHKSLCPIAGLAAEIGLLFSYPSGFDIALNLSAEFCLMLVKSNDYGPDGLSFYRNGIYNAYIPELSIYYRF